MAMNKQRRTANLNNIVTYDTLKNVTLPADLTIEGLTGAGFVKADANGLLSVDTGAYLPIPSQTGNAGKFLSTDGANISWQSVPQDVNIYSSDGTLTGNRTVNSGGFTLTFNPYTTFNNQILQQNSVTESGGSLFSYDNKLNILNFTRTNDNVTTRAYNSRSELNLIGQTANARISGHGYYSVINRTSATDISTSSSGNLLYGFYSVITQSNGNKFSSLIRNYYAFPQVYQGTAGDVDMYRGFCIVGTSTSSASVTNVSGIKLHLQAGWTSGSFTGTVTNYYAVNIETPSLGTTGTITNRWGIYAPDSAMRHHLNGNVLIGTTTDAGYKLDVNGTGRFTSDVTFGNAMQGKIHSPTSTTIRFVGRGVPVGIEFPYVDGAKDATGFLFADNAYYVETKILGWNGYGVGIKNGILKTDISGVPSAILSIFSTTQGFLAPRMTNAQRTAISTPATGLMAYSTDATEGMYLNLSGGWQRLLTSGDTIANIYNSDGTLTGNRIVSLGGNKLSIGAATSTFANGQLELGINNANAFSFVIKNTAGTGGAGIVLGNNADQYIHIGTSGGSLTFPTTNAGFIHQSSIAALYFTGGSFSQPTTSDVIMSLFRANKNVVIGGTTDAGYKLDVQGTGRYTGDLSIPTGKIIIGSNTNGINLALDNDTAYPTNQNIKIGNIGSTSSSLRNVTIANTGGVPVALTGSENTLLGTSLGFDTTASGMVIVAHNAQGFSGSSIKSNSIVITGSFYQYVQSIQNSIIMGSSGYTATYIGKDYLSKTQINNAIALRASAFDNSFTAGLSGGHIKDVAFGQGLYERYFDFTSASYTIHGTTPIGVNNVNGANITIAGGRATGNAFGGDVVLSTAVAGSSGSTIQTLTERMRVMNQNGYVRISTGLGFGQISDASQPTVVGSNTGGTLPDGTYLYRIAAVDALGGVTLPGGENGVAFSGTAGTNSVQITWPAMTGAVSYRIYRRLSYIGDPTGYFTSSTNSFTDTGAAITTAPYPYNNNTVRYYINSSGGGVLGAMTFASDITVNGLTIGRGNNQDQTNTAIGINALKVSTAINNTALGYASLQLNTTGAGNTALGRAAGANNISGSNNTYVGLNSGIYATSGSNTLIGCVSGSNLTTGGGNTFIGYNSGFDITTGSQNTIIGVFPYAGILSSSTSNNIILADGIGNIRIRAFDTGNVTINSNTDAGYKLDVNGSTRSVTFRSDNSSQAISGSTAYQPNYFFGLATYANAVNTTAVVSGTWSQINHQFNTSTISNATALTTYNVVTMLASGGTVTVTQPSYLNAVSSINAQNYITGSVNMTLTHLAGIVVKPVLANAAGTLTVTNYYAALINDSTQSAAAFSPTNRWGIYQEGASDKNYFNGRVLVGTTSDNGTDKLQVNGSARFNTSTYQTQIASTGILFNSQRGGQNYSSALYAHSFDGTSINYIYAASRPNDVATNAVVHYVGTDNMVYWDTTNAQYRFLVSGSEAMRLTTNRNLLLGGTSDSGKKLQVTGEVNVTSGNATSIEISNTAGNYHLLMSSVSVAAAYGMYISGSDMLFTKTGAASPNITVKSTNGDVVFGNTIKTAAPTGYTAQPWKLGDATSGTVTPNYYIKVEINGQIYSIPALQGTP